MEIHKELESVIGQDATERLCKYFGGLRIYIPSWQTLQKERQKANIVEDVQRGEDIKKVARHYGWSVNGVHKIVKNHAKNK